MIGIFGGGFDPIHNGHIACIEVALASLVLDRLYLLPYSKSLDKSEPYFATNIRLDLLKLAVKPYKKVAIDSQEIIKNSPSYTIDTLRNIYSQNQNQIIILLMGVDSFNTLASWKHYRQIAKYCHIGIFNRPNYKLQTTYNFELIATSSALLQKKRGLLFVLQKPAVELSSSLVRTKIKKAQNLDKLLPVQVSAYISAVNSKN